MSKVVLYTTSMISRFVPVTSNSMDVYTKIITYYNDGTQEETEELTKTIYFDSITDWA